MKNNYWECYERMIDSNGNIIGFLDKRTGEITNVDNTLCPEGTRHYTPAQQEEFKKQKERETKSKLWRNTNKKHTHINADYRYNNISPESIGRLMFLSTFLGYEDNFLMISQKAKMSKKDLIKVMKLPTTTFYRFFNEVKDKYIITDNSGYLRLREDYFHKGNFTVREKGKKWQSLYKDTIQMLYYKTPIHQHRHIGYIFSLLPYVNIEYNIVCKNPEEKQLDKIDFLTINELCEKIGYSKEHRNKLKDNLKQLVFDVDGRKEPFCSFVLNNSTNISDARMYINPRILYIGHRAEEVQILGKFCEI